MKTLASFLERLFILAVFTIVVSFLVVLVLFKVRDLFAIFEITNTQLSIIIPAMTAVCAFYLTKMYERKTLKEKTVRERNIDSCQEYIQYLLECREQNSFSIDDLQAKNKDLIFKVSDDTIKSIQKLVNAIEMEKDIDKNIGAVIKSMRSDMGLTSAYVFEDPVRSGTLCDLILPRKKTEIKK